MAAYVAACVLWVAVIQPLLSPSGTTALQTIGLVAFLGVTGSLLYRAFGEQTIALSEARAARLHAQEHLRAIVDHSPTRINLKGADGRFLLVNQGFADWFGLPVDQLVGRSLLDVFPADLASRYEAMDRAVVESGRPSEFTILHEREGRARTSALIKFPVRTPDGDLLGVGTIAADATEKVEAETVLRRAKEAADLANRAKSQFLAAMSHELRTPLNAIIGFSEMLTGSTTAAVSSTHVQEYAEAIHQSGSHLLGIINDILDISRIEAGKLALNEDVFSLPEVVESAAQLVRQRAARSGVQLVISVPEDCPLVCADEQRLRQILINLLSNAVKFTRRDGTVEVTAAWEKDLVISVRDTGIGMSKEDIPKALALFGQIDNQLSRNYEGTGLGLPLSKAFAELHGGSLEITSDPGIGTTVSVRLPASRIVEPSHRPPTAERLVGFRAS